MFMRAAVGGGARDAAAGIITKCYPRMTAVETLAEAGMINEPFRSCQVPRLGGISNAF